MWPCAFRSLLPDQRYIGTSLCLQGLHSFEAAHALTLSSLEPGLRKGGIHERAFFLVATPAPAIWRSPAESSPPLPEVNTSSREAGDALICINLNLIYSNTQAEAEANSADSKIPQACYAQVIPQARVKKGVPETKPPSRLVSAQASWLFISSSLQ